MERKDFNYLSPVEIKIYSKDLPKLIRKKDTKDQDAFVLQQKRKEEEHFLKMFFYNNPEAPLV